MCRMTVFSSTQVKDPGKSGIRKLKSTDPELFLLGILRDAGPDLVSAAFDKLRNAILLHSETWRNRISAADIEQSAHI